MKTKLFIEAYKQILNEDSNIINHIGIEVNGYIFGKEYIPKTANELFIAKDNINYAYSTDNYGRTIKKGDILLKNPIKNKFYSLNGGENLNIDGNKIVNNISSLNDILDSKSAPKGAILSSFLIPINFDNIDSKYKEKIKPYLK